MAFPQVSAEELAAVLPLLDPTCHDVVRQVCSPDFDEARFVSGSLLSSPARVVEQLQLAVKSLSDEVRRRVVQNHDELMRQSGQLDPIEARLGKVLEGVMALSGTVKQIQSDVLGPFVRLRQSTRQLRDIQEASDVLRGVIRVLDVSAKLEEQLQRYRSSAPAAKSRELAKTAALLRDVEEVLDQPELRGVAAVADRRSSVADTGKLVRQLAEKMLFRGTDAMDRVEIGHALQVYFQLGELRPAVWRATDRVCRNLAAKVESSVDVTALGGAAGGGGVGSVLSLASSSSSGAAASSSSSASASAAALSSAASALGSAGGALPPQAGEWRQALWERTEGLLHALVMHTQQVATLQATLWAKTDSATEQSFREVYERDVVVAGAAGAGAGASAAAAASAADVDAGTDKASNKVDGDLLRRFWGAAVAELAERLRVVAGGSSFVRTVYVREFPRLHRAFEDVMSGVRREAQGSLDDPSCASALLDSVGVFRLGFLEHSLSRLEDRLRATFPGGGRAPSVADVAKLAAAVHEELVAAGDAPRPLQGDMLAAVGSVCRHFATECEGLLVADPAPEVEAHAVNAALFAAVGQLAKALAPAQVLHVAPKLEASAPAGTMDQLSRARHTLQGLNDEVLAALTRSAVRGLAGPLASMHDEKFDSRSEPAPGAAARPTAGARYLAKVKERAEAFRSRLLPLYQTPRTPSERWKEVDRLRRVVADRLLRQFALHASLVFPVSEQGRLRLASDMALLEDLAHALDPEPAATAAKSAASVSVPASAAGGTGDDTPAVVGAAPTLADSVAFLREFKGLMFRETSEMLEEPRPTDQLLLPAIHLVLARHSNELTVASPMPHAVLGWTLERYVLWVEGHSVADQLDLVRSVIQSLLNGLKLPSSGVTEFLREHYLPLFVADQLAGRRSKRQHPPSSGQSAPGRT